MYIIGHIIIGTHLPWGAWSDIAAVRAAYARDLFERDPNAFRKAIEDTSVDPAELADISNEELLAGIEENGDEFPLPEDLWETLYHGGADDRPMYVGVEIDSFDETDHFPLSSIANVRPTAQQKVEAMRKYLTLPQRVRKLLPPFDVYVVWGSS